MVMVYITYPFIHACVRVWVRSHTLYDTTYIYGRVLYKISNASYKSLKYYTFYVYVRITVFEYNFEI